MEPIKWDINIGFIDALKHISGQIYDLRCCIVDLIDTLKSIVEHNETVIRMLNESNQD